MKIMIINPDYGMTREELDLRLEILSQYVGPDTELAMECLTETQVYIDSALDVVLAGPEIIKRAIQAEKDGYDAVVIYCFSDPALEACREVVSIPVVGGAQSSYLVSEMISRQSGVLIPNKNRIPEKKIYRFRTGVVVDDVTVIRHVDLKGVDVWKEREKAVDILVKAAKKMIAEDEIQAILLGCLVFLGMAEEISEKVGVPVIDAGVAAVSLAESLVRQKLMTSKLAYTFPPKGSRKWVENEIVIE